MSRRVDDGIGHRQSNFGAQFGRLNGQVCIECDCVINKLARMSKELLSKRNPPLSEEFFEYFVDDDRRQYERLLLLQETRVSLGLRAFAKVFNPSRRIDDVSLRSVRSDHGLRFSNACPWPFREVA